MLKPNRDAAPPSQPKRAYTKPRLTEFGDITKLTQNGQGSGVDAGMGGTMFMMCL